MMSGLEFIDIPYFITWSSPDIVSAVLGTSTGGGKVTAAA